MRLYKFFDKLEDKVRGRLSHFPIVYGIIGGVTVVMFWRGIWHSADMLEESGGFLSVVLSAPVSAIISAFILLLTGLFVSFFIGDRIILSGLKHEKKIEEKTEEEVRAEGAILVSVYEKLKKMEKDIEEIKSKK